ncbi:TMAO reductase system sensor histidine kinase/response regulator TorS [Vibrio sp. TRT 17S01]|uniref:TMAO reductase system sensor histidine kinase/response regulator TorS n=1 Tax=Vibrio sp. TRT 17S01 TaxID=3418505 RepID=UPI003CF22D9E
MLFAKASIGRKLLFAFTAMALLVILSSLIGVFGFSSVARTERNVVNSAIPSMIEARQVSELSSRIITSVQSLSNAKSEKQRKESGQLLFSQLETLLSHIKQLGSDSFDSELLNTLESDVQQVIDTLAQLGILVEKKLFLANDLDVRVKEMRKFAQELEQLTRTQVSNTSTIAVANVTHIYDLLKNGKKESAYNALDTLVEVDLDLSERLHELHLLAFKMLNHIEEMSTISNLDRINQIRNEYSQNLTIMKRRVQSVEDPTRSMQMADLLNKLAKREVVFQVLINRYQNEQASQQLLQNTLTQFTKLNTTVNRLVDDSNAATTNAVSELKTTLQYAQLSLTIITIIGLVIVVLIVWKVVYKSVLKRLAEYSSALSSIAQGQLKVDVTVQGKDELARMGQAIITARNTAQALKVVAESEAKAKRELEEHKVHLEEVVTERTCQLQETNNRLNQEVLNHAKARHQAEQASRAKSAFLATMSHEIRTPMNGVLGTTRLLKESSLNETQKHYVDVINRSGKTLLAILNDVLDYSKIEAGHLEIRTVDFDLKAMVDDVYQLLKGRAEEKQIDFTCYVDSDLDRYWQGDVTRISQVLTNLVGNAIKFTDHGHVDIYVSPDPIHEKNVLFEVSDSGVGICTEEQQTLFDAFTQASAGINSKGGTGLGLAISKRIVDAMNGTLAVESECGEGSRFWFSVPLEKGKEVATLMETQLQSNNKATVLLVEDNPVNCMVAEGFLVHMGHQVDTALNGEQAKELFHANQYDIALLDINLPDCNGMELREQLREIGEQSGNSDVPMIAVSAHVFNEEVEGYLASGFDGYLPKPLDKDDLAALISSHVKGVSMDTTPNNHHEPKESVSMPLSSLIKPEIVINDTAVLGKAKMLEIIELFKQGADDIQEKLELAFQTQDASEVKQLAHKLKGSSGSLGLNRLFEICENIEKSSHPVDSYKQSAEELATCCTESYEALVNIIN